MTVEEIKDKIQSLEKASASEYTPEPIKVKMQGSIADLKKQLEALEGKAEKKVDEAEKKVDEAEKKVKEAETSSEKKEAKAELKDAKDEQKEAKEDAKEVEQVSKKAETVAERIRKIHGGRRAGAGRPRQMERMKREKGVHGGKRVGSGRKRVASSTTKMLKPVAKEAKSASEGKMKSVRAFGQTVEYKNDADFCRQLIKAFKKRKIASKKSRGKRRTAPVFGVITKSVKNAVSKALHSVSDKQIEKNPKAFLAKATRLEKSAIRFLEDFKAILGSDYKKSEITAEFGELEKSIKGFVAKFTKK